MFRWLALCAVLVLFPMATPAADDAGAAQAQFHKSYAEFKDLLARVRQLRERYHSDPKADKPALESDYNEKLAQAREVNVKLGALAEKAYLAAPNTDSEVNEFLFTYLATLVNEDRFEAATKIARVLDDNKFEHRAFDLFAGRTYFATSDFDRAEPHLKAAEKSGEIDQIGQSQLAAIDREKLAWEAELKLRAAEDKADNLPKVKLTTSKGDIVVVLFEDQAPIAVSNFISLVEKKYYDGLKFHRVIPGFMAQGGDPKGDGSGGPGYTIADECRQENHRNHFRGSLSMAKASEPNTGGSQFFLNFTPTPHLDGQHTVFGRIIEGQDVVSKLERLQPSEPGTPDKIVKATVLRKRNHSYENFLKKQDLR